MAIPQSRTRDHIRGLCKYRAIIIKATQIKVFLGFSHSGLRDKYSFEVGGALGFLKNHNLNPGNCNQFEVNDAKLTLQ